MDTISLQNKVTWKYSEPLIFHGQFDKSIHKGCPVAQQQW